MPASITKNKQLQWIGDHFEDFQQNGDGYKALCPAHDDSNPSLSFDVGDDGRILVNCFAGCPIDEVLAEVDLSFRDLMPGAKQIVATYDYQDEQGDLLYQVVRYEPKTFRQRQPKEGGGWNWSTKGIRRVLYRLPQLLEVDPKRGVVFITAGEKDADRLAKLGFVATTNVGGEGPGKWRHEYNQFLKDRHVVILVDNDPSGWDHAKDVAQQLAGVARIVKVLELPGLPDHGDVSDWLDAGGTPNDLRALAKKTKPYKPSPFRLSNPKGSTHQAAKTTLKTSVKPEGYNLKGKGKGRKPGGQPEGLVGKKVAPFPVEVLPKLLRKYVESIADALPCPVDFPAAMMLPVLSTFIGRKRCIEVKPSWREYPILWVACVARSGDRKSPAFEFATEPLQTTQRRLLAEYLREKEACENDPDLPKPSLQQVLTTDTTIEALKEILSINPAGICYPADELSGWVRSIGQYKGGKGDDRQIWLSIWSGSTIVCNRKSSPEPVIIPDPFVSVVGGIQPDALGDIIDSSREDGFSARVLFSWPDPMPHSEWSEDVVKQSVYYTSTCCDQLWHMEPSQKPITFSAPAKKLWVEWVNAHRAEKPLDNLRATWSGAPLANVNASKNGTRLTRLTLGELPKTMRRQLQNARKYRRFLEGLVMDAHDEVNATHAHLVDEACAAEVHASVCRWLLRTRLETMTVGDITRCSEQIVKSKTIRNKAVQQLKIDTELEPLDLKSYVIESGNNGNGKTK